MTRRALLSSFLFAAAILLPSSFQAIAKQPATAPQASENSRGPYLGTWVREVSDSTGTTRITLELRDDGSYSKALDAILRGHQFHNDERGSWSASGPVVLCSGDGAARRRGTTCAFTRSSADVLLAPEAGTLLFASLSRLCAKVVWSSI